MDEATKNINALRLAYKAHESLYTGSKDGKQWRKWSVPQEPYINHPLEVSTFATQHPKAKPVWYRAAILHDTEEDTSLDMKEVVEQCDQETRDWVSLLTNPSKGSPQLNRAERKAIDREHWSRLAKSKHPTAIIKLCDIRANCNVRSMYYAPRDFKKLYCHECLMLSDELRPVDEVFYARAVSEIRQVQETLVEEKVTKDLIRSRPDKLRGDDFFSKFVMEMRKQRLSMNMSSALYFSALRQVLMNQLNGMPAKDAATTAEIIGRIEDWLRFKE